MRWWVEGWKDMPPAAAAAIYFAVRGVRDGLGGKEKVENSIDKGYFQIRINSGLHVCIT